LRKSYVALQWSDRDGYCGAVKMAMEEAVIKEEGSRDTTGIKKYGQTSTHHHGSCQQIFFKK
jgi:hypothetical protein